MIKKKNELSYQISLIRIHHENVSWSNVIINSPISYNLLERRAMYFLTGEVKHKFVEKGLGVPKNWKELYFYLTDDDLGKSAVFVVLDATIENNGLKIGGNKRLLIYNVEVGHKVMIPNLKSLYKPHKDTDLLAV